jgi:hypothetical protein
MGIFYFFAGILLGVLVLIIHWNRFMCAPDPNRQDSDE